MFSTISHLKQKYCNIVYETIGVPKILQLEIFTKHLNCSGFEFCIGTHTIFYWFRDVTNLKLSDFKYQFFNKKLAFWQKKNY